MAVNYGGQDEIVRGVNKMINDKLEMINSSDFS